MAEKRISKFRLKDLPDELKEKLDTKFWTTPAIERTSRSSFGTSPKSKESVFHDDGYAVVKLSQEWVAVDKYNSNHGRVRVESSLGKLLDTPGAGHYTPKIDMQSKRETIAPPITISEKPADHFFEELEDLKNTRTEILKLTAPLAKERKKRTKIATYKIKRGDLADVNIDDMRKGLCRISQQKFADFHYLTQVIQNECLVYVGLLPGPGTYVIDCPLAERFEKPPTPKLKPKKNAAIPRKVILPETLDILDSPSQKQPAGKDAIITIHSVWLLLL